jgi:CRP/FNR family transcriptional regulator
MPLVEKFTSERRYERGQTVYCMDDPANELYEVKTGRVKIVRISPDGQQKILDIYQAGDFFGELCICGGHYRKEQAVAMESLAVTSFKMDGLMRILRRKPDMVLGLLQLFCTRLGESQDQIATLAFENIPRRLAGEILRLSRGAGPQQERNGSRVCVELTHEELAHLVGTSREMVTTVMTQFRQRGLLDYARRQIQVDPAQVEKFLHDSQ